MAWRRIVVFMGVFLVMALLLISSQVADARDLTQTPNRVQSKESEKIDDDLIGTDRFRCDYGCCGPNCGCCTYPGEEPNTQTPSKPHK